MASKTEVVIEKYPMPDSDRGVIWIRNYEPGDIRQPIASSTERNDLSSAGVYSKQRDTAIRAQRLLIRISSFKGEGKNIPLVQIDRGLIDKLRQIGKIA